MFFVCVCLCGSVANNLKSYVGRRMSDVRRLGRAGKEMVRSSQRLTKGSCQPRTLVQFLIQPE